MASSEQITGYKAEAQSVIQDDRSVRYYIADTEDNRRFGFVGHRLTDCCAACSTYMDDGIGGQSLCCKSCYHEVDNGQGDGDEVLNADGTVTDHGNRSITISLTG